MDRVDGNALAGPLFEVLQVDITTLECRCTSCHHEHELARATVYVTAMGAVLRCPSCDDVQGVLVEIRGVRSLRMPGLALVGTTP